MKTEEFLEELAKNLDQRVFRTVDKVYCEASIVQEFAKHENKELIEENRKLRIFMWINHNIRCGLHTLYGDDGDMQCSNCGIDFKRWKVDDILLKLKNINLEKLKK